MKQFLAVIFVIMISVNVASSQNILESLNFEAPGILIAPKANKTIKIYKTPSLKSPIVKIVYDYDSGIIDYILNATSYNNLWYKVDGGYVKKNLVRLAKRSPLLPAYESPTFYTSCDLDCRLEWYYADSIGSQNLSILYVQDNCELENSRQGLYLGKRFNDVLVFRYHLPDFYIELDETNDNAFSLGAVEEEWGSGTRLLKTLKLGLKYYKKGVVLTDLVDSPNAIRPNFRMFNDAVINYLFEKIIKKGPNVNIYMTIEHFNAEYMNQLCI